MSIDALRWAWKAAAPLIDSSGALFVLVVLADHASDHDGEDWTCFPAVSKIGKRTRLSERVVERHLLWLIKDGWVSREARGVRKAEKGKFTYTLHPERAGVSPDKTSGQSQPPSPVKTSGETGLASPVKTSGEGAAVDPTILQASPDKSCSPPTPPYKAEPPKNPHSACAGAEGTSEKMFAAVFAAFASAAPTSVARPRDWTAWQKVVEGGVDPERLADAAGRYLQHVAKDGGRVFSLQRWLSDAKWEPFLEAPAIRAEPARRVFAAPEPVMAVLAANPQHDWPAYLGRCRWDGEASAIVCPGHVEERELRTWLAKALGAIGVGIIVKREAA